ncbi:hypothetical protein H112_04738 [Trichophyton rubrum D6]|uniref:WD repeat protein n=3 Tax=Trichophyton rubrum TaxID=5551 RepID=A0A178F4I4_TRIRU|nr:uncharacterized protein TERG_04501 [Trichophyton rubrum CBS 118892]EZF22281.1 hypothetical protein H100_04746 [Trichophyton rubrum MR850]EZF41430.1 hypothetical protein H102_04734 [Trichophyton rubrum CBS 100081]EZF52005.1 hypothetical protein H103_04739 [Trichophyton rubrum CBS 288.86]EZF62661.1 hypothetical protein H104_04725 [Trichophyton rubrum CBS 289.86]EZF83909.1 hypothetical protein H110_04735 [Trichophyton rubrum MR1448]EZF94805.1 hypothetical protein H113_04773 [Trichophyton rubr
MELGNTSLPRRSKRISQVLGTDSDDDENDVDPERELRRLLGQFLSREHPSSTPREPNSLKRKAECLTDRQNFPFEVVNSAPSTSADNFKNIPSKRSPERSSAPIKGTLLDENDNVENEPPGIIENDVSANYNHNRSGEAINADEVFYATSDGPSKMRALLPEATQEDNNILDPETSNVDSSHSLCSHHTSWTLASSVSLRSRSSESPGNAQIYPIIPITRPRGRPPGSPNMSRRNNNSTPQRRSRRERQQPTNYYALPPGFVEIEDGYEPAAPEEPVNLQYSPQVPSLARKRIDIIPPRCLYRSRQLCILRELISPLCLNEEDPPVQLPYILADQRINRSRLLPPDNQYRSFIYHVDFSTSEMKTIYTLLCGHPIPEDETPIQDHLFRAVQFLDIELITKKIRRLKHLLTLLPPSFDPAYLFLSHARIPKEYQKILEQIEKIFRDTHQSEGCKNLVAKIDRANINSLLQECDVVKGLQLRKANSIMRFLSDALSKSLPNVPSSLVVYSSPVSPETPLASSDDKFPSALMRSRQLGLTNHRGRNPVNASLRTLQSRRWELWKTWKGASHDVLVLSWSLDGTQFIAGTSTHCEENNMQYNRNNNLLLGNLVMDSIRELPDHRIPRRFISGGEFTNQATYNNLDPDLYMTVSAVQWSEKYLYTASYDKTVRVWDTQPEVGCIQQLFHPEKLDVMAVSDCQYRLVGTGCQDTTPVRIWSPMSNGTHTCVELEKYQGYVPSSLAWGTNSSCSGFLAAGMSRKLIRLNLAASKYGSIVLWQVEAPDVRKFAEWEMSLHISDIKWHRNQPLFIAGCSTPQQLATSKLTNVRSTVYLYDPLRTRYEVSSFQCPALDINEITFCPSNDNYVTASCTDNLTYVYDRRNPSSVLHKLGHGKPIHQLNTSVTQEEDDTGVCLATWSGSTFFTGGSDGVVKTWDIRRSADDLIFEDIATFNHGVMSGALSPDQTNLLIGDSGGSVHILSTAPFSRENGLDLAYHAAEVNNQTNNDCEESVAGILESKKLVASGKLTRHPIFGFGKGPLYEGPYATWARPPGTSPNEIPYTPLEPAIQAEQLDGPPISQRQLLDQDGQHRVHRHISLALARNRQSSPARSPRKSQRLNERIEPSTSQIPQIAPRETIEISSEDSDVVSRPKRRRYPLRSPRKTKKQSLRLGKPTCIDLTGDTSEDELPRSSSISSYATCVSRRKPYKVEADLLEEDNWCPTSEDVTGLGL